MSDTRMLAMPQDEMVSVLLDRLVNEYWYLLYHHIRLYIKDDRALVEDIAQQTFEKALVALRLRYSTEQIANLKAKSWLMAIASNLCIDHIRCTQQVLSLDLLQAVNSDPWADRVDPQVDLRVDSVDLRSSPEYLLEVSEIFAEVQECIKAHVSKRYQSCVILHLRGWKPQEIADKLIIALSSVRTYTSKGMEQLRQAYALL